ncbi:MAG TPA: gas vesicle protein K [Solirubrobacteraceae bacterium]|nr:gas vesicle protein K [Solirubrobacteraceae bacterium]
MTGEKVLVPPPDAAEPGRTDPLESPAGRDVLSRRINAEPEEVEKGLAQLVLTIVELLRQLMERQALRRVQAGGLSDQQIERLGHSLMLLAERMDELKEQFGLQDDDLNLNLGPLGNLM